MENLYKSDWSEIKLLSKTIPINQHDSIDIIGQAISGTRNCLVIPALGVVFDIGFCPSIATRQATVLVSHGHGDHIGSLHLHAFDRRLHRLGNPNYVMPIECVSNFQKGYDAFKQLNRHGYVPSQNQFRIIPVKEEVKEEVDENNDRILLKLPKTKLNGTWVIRAYKTIHGVPSYAYVISQIKQRLKETYRGLEGKEIGALVMQGVQVNEETQNAILAYTGDTTIEGVLQHPELLQTQVLIMECTYIILDDGKNTTDTPEEAKKRGHIHEADIHENAESFQNKHIVLCHFSPRYKRSDILITRTRLQKTFGERTTIEAFV